MTKGLQIIKENKNLAEWSRQVEECRNSGLSVRSWCEQHQSAAASVRIGGICAEIHNGADEATLTAIFRALKSC